MKFSSVVLTISLGVFLLIAFSKDVLCQVSEPRLKCTSCPVSCTSSQKYILSCRNACKSYNLNLTDVQCVDGMCQCNSTVISVKNSAG